MAAPLWRSCECFRGKFYKELAHFHATRAKNYELYVNKKRQLTSDCQEDVPLPVKPPKRKVIFSGVQPTGSLHLGNYFGAVSNWVRMQETTESLFISIVDLHSITLPQDPVTLRSNVLQMTASLLACGVDPKKSTLFLQSMVPEHAELAWVLGCLSTMARLGHLPQYKEKSAKLKEIPLGIYVYPVLQSADILLYKATHVPVGIDQLQHVQLAQDLSRIFNRRFGRLFPSPHAEIVDDAGASRVRSLRDHTKKMSKSDEDPRSRIELTDASEVVVERIRKAVTDFDPTITYDPETRPAVSNLVEVHCLVSGLTPEQVVEDARGLDTVAYKARLAEVVNSRLAPVRDEIARLSADPGHLEAVLRDGSARARSVASATWSEVRRLVGFV